VKEWIEWTFQFLGRALEQPELAAIVAGMLAGMAMTYFVQRLLPWQMAVSRAELIGRIVTALTTLGIALIVHFTARTFAFALTPALLAPLLYESAGAVLYHRWPWLKPHVLRTGADFGRCDPDDEEHA
jgi:hypothetical protein